MAHPAHTSGSLLIYLSTQPEPLAGSYKSDVLTLIWDPARLRIWTSENASPITLQKGDMGAVQLSWSSTSGRTLLHLELRGQALGRIRLHAPVLNTEFLEGLPELELQGDTELELSTLLDLISTLHHLGAHLTSGTVPGTGLERDNAPPGLSETVVMGRYALTWGAEELTLSAAPAKGLGYFMLGLSALIAVMMWVLGDADDLWKGVLFCGLTALAGVRLLNAAKASATGFSARAGLLDEGAWSSRTEEQGSVQFVREDVKRFFAVPTDSENTACAPSVELKSGDVHWVAPPAHGLYAGTLCRVLDAAYLKRNPKMMREQLIPLQVNQRNLRIAVVVVSLLGVGGLAWLVL